LRGDRSERGAALLIGLLFMTIGSLLALALASSAGNNLLNTSNFQTQRNLEYAADGALTGAVQASRYHFPPTNPPQPCVNYAPTAPLANGLYVYVQCYGTPMLVNTNVSTGGGLLLSPASAGSLFVPEDNGILVSGGCILGAQIVTYQSPTVLSMSQPATCTTPGSTPTILGGQQQRTVLFQACVSSSPFSGSSPCPASKAIATAIVTYSDTDNAGNQLSTTVGYNANIQSWVVKTANG
jgi:hypothetical protein